METESAPRGLRLLLCLLARLKHIQHGQERIIQIHVKMVLRLQTLFFAPGFSQTS